MFQLISQIQNIMNNSWKNRTILALILLNVGLIYLIFSHRPPHPPRLAKELQLSEGKSQKLKHIETTFIKRRKSNIQKMRKMEHEFMRCALRQDSISMKLMKGRILQSKKEDLGLMEAYFHQLGLILNKNEQTDALNIIGNFERKPRH